MSRTIIRSPPGHIASSDLATKPESSPPWHRQAWAPPPRPLPEVRNDHDQPQRRPLQEDNVIRESGKTYPTGANAPRDVWCPGTHVESSSRLEKHLRTSARNAPPSCARRSSYQTAASTISASAAGNSSMSQVIALGVSPGSPAPSRPRPRPSSRAPRRRPRRDVESQAPTPCLPLRPHRRLRRRIPHRASQAAHARSRLALRRRALELLPVPASCARSR